MTRICEDCPKPVNDVEPDLDEIRFSVFATQFNPPLTEGGTRIS